MTPRILTTNWSWDSFWAPEAFLPAHMGPIRRRILWVNIKNDLRKTKEPSSARPSVEPTLPILTAIQDDEDVFGFGGSLYP